METIRVGVAVKNGNRMLRLRAQFEIDARGPVADRNRRARHQRKLQLARDLHHALRLQPAVGKMLVAEDRDALAGRPKDIGNLEEQLIAGIKMLALLVPGIVAMLADQQYAIDGKPLAAKRQGFPDRGIDRDMVLLGHLAAHVVFRHLRRIHRHDFRARPRRLAVLAKAFQIFADNHIGMRVVPVFGHDGGDTLGLAPPERWPPAERRQWREIPFVSS